MNIAFLGHIVSRLTPIVAALLSASHTFASSPAAEQFPFFTSRVASPPLEPWISSNVDRASVPLVGIMAAKLPPQIEALRAEFEVAESALSRERAELLHLSREGLVSADKLTELITIHVDRAKGLSDLKQKLEARLSEQRNALKRSASPPQ